MPSDEPQRLAALKSYTVIDTPSEAEFDHIVKLAADLFHVPIALVSFVGEDRQFFKAKLGLAACETAREASFCTYTLMGREVLVIADAQADQRFRNNPMVTGSPFIRFYAGAPITNADGYRIGSVCVIDTQPRSLLNEHERRLLQSLAKIVMDHLERRRLNILKQAAMKMAAATPDAIVCSREDGAISFWNAAAERMFGFTRSEAMGQHVDLIIPSDHRPAHRAEIERVRVAGGMNAAGAIFEICGVRKNGTEFPIEVSLALWRDGARNAFGAIIRDVSERHQARARLHQLTHFDRLTGLPNRVRFLEQLNAALSQSGQHAVLKIGLDKFKALNGSMGMAVGDRILITAAQRVSNLAGPDAFVARLGADEFGVLLTGRLDPPAIEALGERILTGLSEGFAVHGATCHLGASAGIVVCRDGAAFEGPDAVLKAALLALQQAKQAGGGRYELFQPQFGVLADERRHLEEELRKAFERHEFELHFQPQVRLVDQRIVGAEALLRWRHPQKGLLSPAIFLPTLENSAVAINVGDWITRTACAFAAEAAASGAPIRIGVNLFGVQLRDAGLCDRITEALACSGLPAEMLELEITETTVLGLDEGVLGTLRHLRNMGVGLAFDDYGTGFASLSLLKRYPLTRLKIDREFVRDLETDPDDAAIIKAVLALGHSLELDVIAEGIETNGQAAMLTSYGCNEAQGYLFGRPIPAGEFLLALQKPPLRAA
ncbi:putative bifunctional diguanylate cyclase/phosphodiesterase [Methylobacterium sp. J-068]|uniref:putative bifunctional diguanylate cyclase/phosphodiesterase n=1 Tax=Methylobacterium sp. J-068 TaxID=2836649 RepID=UPI001FB874DF|nr:EAL domain-containing protein [Methylobacterium sp. J-068]MCJ2032756.1 EAL domain-containing protein [Methylobacterium sp. J-068]